MYFTRHRHRNGLWFAIFFHEQPAMRVAVPLTLAILTASILAGCATAPLTPHYVRKQKDPMTPSPGDLRAEQLAYPTGRLEPAWFVDAAQQARAVADGI